MKLNKSDIEQVRYHIVDVCEDINIAKQHAHEWTLINLNGLLPNNSPMATVYINVYNKVWELNNTRSIEIPFSHCRLLWYYPITIL